MNPLSHEDLRKVERDLGERIEAERKERTNAHENLRRELMGRIDGYHAENKGTLGTINSTTSKMAEDMAFLTGKLTGGKATAMELLKGAGWVIATGLLVVEVLKKH